MKNYWLTFGGTDPRSYTGLSPTFIQFFDHLGATLSPPGVTEIFAGSGAYRFQYDVAINSSVFFLADGGATLASTERFVRGVLDPSQKIDLAIGYTGSGYGSTSIDPTDVMGLLRRSQEIQEGNQTFLKSTGAWELFSRGSSTLLTSKVISSSTTGVTRI